MAGLYYVAWISQHIVRSLNKGEYLLQPLSAKDKRDPLRTLTMLHFTYEEWDFANAPQPQFDGFCRWMKQSLLREHPVIFGIFLPDDEFEDYDHIVPAVGLCYKNEDACDIHDDKIIYFDLYDDENVEKCMSAAQFGATRRSINRKRNSDNGCLPLDVSIFSFVWLLCNQNSRSTMGYVSLVLWIKIKQPCRFTYPFLNRRSPIHVLLTNPSRWMVL